MLKKQCSVSADLYDLTIKILTDMLNSLLEAQLKIYFKHICIWDQALDHVFPIPTSAKVSNHSGFL